MLPRLLLLSALHTAAASAFSFSLASPPSQCGNFTAVWDGGQAPFELLLVPVGHVNPEIRTIVDQTINSGSSASLTLKFPKGSQFVAVLSDATGPGAGGTTDILTVGDGPTDCLSGPVQPKFFLFMDNTPSQCASAPISWSSTATGQVSIWGIIPGGNTFSLNPLTSGASFNWMPNVKAGTDMMIVAGDANGRGTGGSTDIFAVGGGDGGCLSGNSPSTTAKPAAGQVLAATASGSSSGASPTSGTAGGSSSSSGSSASAASKGSDISPSALAGSGGGTVSGQPEGAGSGMHSGTIAAIVVGTIGGLIALLVLLFALCRQRRHRDFGLTHRRMRAAGLLDSRPVSIAAAPDAALGPAPHENVPRSYEPEPFVYRPRRVSGYSADVSGESGEQDDDEARSMRRQLLQSPMMSPYDENGPTTSTESGHAPWGGTLAVPRGAVLGATASPAPTYATRGLASDHATAGHAHDRRGRMTPYTNSDGAVSSGTVDIPPIYDSWNAGHKGPLVAVNRADADEKSAIQMV